MIVTASALLFDLDGVLVDSTPVITRIWEQWAMEHGFEPVKTVREAHGRPSLESIRELLPDADHEALNRDLEQREIDDTEGVVPVRGSIELLASLPPDRWSLVTSCGRDLAEARVQAGGHPIPRHMVTFNDVQNGKPDPEPYLLGACILGFSAADCIAIEDAPAGIVSGKAAGARVIALRTTATDEELRSASPDWILDDCSSISATFDPATGVLRLDLALPD